MNIVCTASSVFSLGVFQRAQCPLHLLMCPLVNTPEAECALWKAVKVSHLPEGLANYW